MLANLSTAADRLAEGASKLPALITALEATSRRAGNSTADLQQSLVPMLRDMQATAANLRETTEALRQDPAQVLLGGPPPRERARCRRRAVLASLLGLGGCGLSQRPYLERRQWPLIVRRPAALPARARGRVLLVRSIRAGPGLEARGLQSLQPDGSVKVDFYEEWAVPPAQAIEDDLRQWLAASGLFAAVLAPGSQLPADLVMGRGISSHRLLGRPANDARSRDARDRAARSASEPGKGAPPAYLHRRVAPLRDRSASHRRGAPGVAGAGLHRDRGRAGRGRASRLERFTLGRSLVVLRGARAALRCTSRYSLEKRHPSACPPARSATALSRRYAGNLSISTPARIKGPRP